MSRDYDVVIIGSGAGGAPIAHTLVKKRPDLRVLVLDKGPLMLAQYQAEDGLSDFKRDELFATGTEKRINLPVSNNGGSYYGSHVEPDLNDEPHIYRTADGQDKATIEGYTAHVVGGGTQIYGGVSLRFSPTDFRLKSFNEPRQDLEADPKGDVRREARDWPISYDDLEPYYARAEELIGISGSSENQEKPFTSGVKYQKPTVPNPISDYVEKGMEALGMKHYRTPLAVITEDHAPSGRKVYDARTGYVNRYGCPLGLKSNTWVSLLWPIYRAPNFELRPNTVVTHLECEGRRISRVHIRDEAGRPDSVTGKLVIVACSAIESVRLLLLSAENDATFSQNIHQGRSPEASLLGKYFLTHCFGGAQVVTPEAWDKSRSVDSDWATDHCATEKFIQDNHLWAGGAIYNNTSDQALPISLARSKGAMDMDLIWKSFTEDASLTGDAMLDYIRGNLGKRVSLAFMANQVPMKSNRIELHTSIRDKWNRKSAYILKDWHSHDVYLMRTLADQCGRILEPLADMAKNIKVEAGGVFQGDNGIIRIANHILGGTRFGKEPNDSVLDENCRAWGFDNLYVTDGGFMPTSGSANPTLTIQANSFRVADHLLTRI